MNTIQRVVPINSNSSKIGEPNRAFFQHPDVVILIIYMQSFVILHVVSAITKSTTNQPKSLPTL